MAYDRLYTFMKVAERASITKAAADLYLTQQAVSKQILLLEDELDLKLFNRSHKLIHLTREGQTLMEEVGPLFEKMKECISTLQGKVGELGGVIKIGAIVECMNEKFYESISTFKIKFPNVRFEIIFDHDYTIEDKILSNEVDIGIIFVYRDQRVLVSERLEAKKILLCCSKDFHEIHGPFKKYSDLWGVPFGEYTHNFGGFGRWMNRNCPIEAKSFMKQQPEIVVYSARAMDSFVSRGVCMALIEVTKAKRQKNQKRLIELFPEAAPSVIDLNLVTKKKETERLIEKEFKSHLLTTWDSDLATK